MKRLYEPETYRAKCPSYWQATLADEQSDRPIQGDRTVECAIIGAGFAGLNAALELTETHVLEPIVLEAEHVGWGASGRNGGFCCWGGSKLSHESQIERFGLEETRRFFSMQRAAIETVSTNLAAYGIDADVHSNGEVELAHRPDKMDELRSEQAFLKETFGFQSQIIEAEALKDHGFESPAFHGAHWLPDGFALHPLKYVRGLAQACREKGVTILEQTPAMAIERRGNAYRIVTPLAVITAKRLLIATNGYSSEDIPAWLGGKLLPALSNILVTRPLAPEELAAQGWSSHQMCFDSRRLLHYFRLMPGIDGEGPRMLFGMRGGVSGTQASEATMNRRLRANFDSFFPAWRSIESDYFWSGLVCLTRDLTCYLGPVGDWENAYAALAWQGNGVSMASYAGRLAAGLIAGTQDQSALPALIRTQPRQFPLPPLRRTYLRAAYSLFEMLDR